MTYKMIVLGPHARTRMRERGITRRDIRWLLAQGLREPTPTAGGAQRWLCRGYLDRREASVVFVEDARTIAVITVLSTRD